MIVCSCLNISDHDVRNAVNWMRASDPETIITAGKVYRALGHRPDCGGCMPLVLDTMRRCESFKVPSPAPLDAPPILRPLKAAGSGETG